jgi:hypothetical protein
MHVVEDARVPSNFPWGHRLRGLRGEGWGSVGELATHRPKFLFQHRAPTGPEKLPINGADGALNQLGREGLCRGDVVGRSQPDAAS